MLKRVMCSNCGEMVDSLCSQCWRCDKCCDCKEKTNRRIDGVIGTLKKKK